jgi:hypothetical protein
MSRLGVFRAVAALAGVASLVSLASCSKTLHLTTDQALIETLAPDVATVYVNFTCGADTTIGLFDSNVNGKKPAWGVMRRRGNPISWVVAQNARPVTITSLGDKPGEDSFPVIVDPNHKGGSPGAPFNATVKADAGVPGQDPPANKPKDKGYFYSIGLTCSPVTGPDIHVVIDPEMIVRRP